jgi:hypothetical protein
MSWFIEAPNNKADACRPQPRKLSLPANIRPPAFLAAAARNNAPSVFVLISATMYQNDGLGAHRGYLRTFWFPGLPQRVGALKGDDHLPSSVSCFDMTERSRGFVQWVCPVDDGCDLRGFDEVLQHEQVPMIRPGKIPTQFLARER